MMAITLVAAHEEGLRSFSSPKNNPLYDPPLAPGFNGDDDYFDEADATYNDNDGGGDDDGEGKDDTFDYVCSAQSCLLNISDNRDDNDGDEDYNNLLKVVCLLFQKNDDDNGADDGGKDKDNDALKVVFIMSVIMITRQ